MILQRNIVIGHKGFSFFHCGALNDGRIKLKNNYSWKITQSQYLNNYNFNDYDLIIIDETQRIGIGEIDEILLKTKETNTMYIFSYDFQQCLASWEIKRNIPQYIKQQVSPRHFKLTEKIRTNQEIASFIKNLFNLRSRNPNKQYPNIDVSYFTTSRGVIKEMEILKSQGWRSEPYYHPTKMLFQIVTRARKKLHLIIFNNEDILKECLNILHFRKR